MDRVIIDGKKYVIVKNYRDALNIADLEGKITDYFANFDYILGDYELFFNQLKQYKYSKLVYIISVLFVRFISLFKMSARFSRNFPLK